MHWDHSVALLRGGYPYLLRARLRAKRRPLELRIMGRRTAVLSGPSGIRLFYDEAVTRRRGAVPRPLQHTLFGRGAVHGLDDARHKQRKALFLDLLTPQAAREVAATAHELWRARPHGGRLDPVNAFDEAVAIHSAAISGWAGVPPQAVDLRLAGDLAALVDGFGSIGLRQLRARRARRRVDRWSRRLVARVRGGHAPVREGCALDLISRYPDLDGRLLPARVAAVELVNLLRPTVAVAYFVAFTAHALGTVPGLADRLAGADEQTYEAFAHELRRYYPFVPLLAGRLRRPVRYEQRLLRRGRRVLLDVYGTLHDPALWPNPDAFDIDRFGGAQPDPERFVPQGGGSAATGHRCPGERLTVELITVAARCMVDAGVSDAPDTRIPLRRMPTRPVS